MIHPNRSAAVSGRLRRRRCGPGRKTEPSVRASRGPVMIPIRWEHGDSGPPSAPAFGCGCDDARGVAGSLRDSRTGPLRADRGAAWGHPSPVRGDISPAPSTPSGRNLTLLRGDEVRRGRTQDRGCAGWSQSRTRLSAHVGRLHPHAGPGGGRARAATWLRPVMRGGSERGHRLPLNLAEAGGYPVYPRR